MKDILKKLRIKKEVYLQEKLSFYEKINKTYPDCFKDIINIKNKISEELSILLSSIPVYKSSKYIIKAGKMDEYNNRPIFWRAPFTDFYEAYDSYGKHIIDKATVEGMVLSFKDNSWKNGNSSEDKIDVDFSKLPNIHIDKAKEFLDCLSNWRLLNKNLSIKNHILELIINDKGSTNIIFNNHKQKNNNYNIESLIYLNDSGSYKNYSYTNFGDTHVNAHIKHLESELTNSKPSICETNMKTILESLDKMNILRRDYIKDLNTLLKDIESKNLAFKLVRNL